MSDVFISYAHETQAAAERIAAALRAEGYRVWRDDEMPAHRAYADVIAERLERAKAVVVVWSDEAVKSDWVRSEADKARAENKLVQVSIDAVALPMPFEQIRCIDLGDWTGEAASESWQHVARSVAELAGRPAPPEPRTWRPVAARRSICVLPFVNMSADPEQEYFSDGISEDIITDLSKVSALSVIARHTAFSFKGRPIDLTRLADDLGVTHVLEGSVRKVGRRVRVTAQLIDGATGDQLWAERWDRDFRNIFALQDDISQAVVAALQLKLAPTERKAIGARGTSRPEAYDLYLMARQYRSAGNEGDPQREREIIGLTQRAIEIDPRYAHAWALMALSQSVLRFNFGQGGDDGLGAAERALALDPDLAEAHAVKGRYLASRGRHDEADAELDTALRLDPQSWEANRLGGLLSFRRRRFEEAARYYRTTTELSDTDFSSPMLLVSCYAALDRPEEARTAATTALARAERAAAQDRSNGAVLAAGCVALAYLGRRERAREWAGRALLIDPHNLVMRYNLACALSRHQGDAVGAIDILEGFFPRADAFWLSHARADPDLDPIRGHRRFQALLAQADARLLSRQSGADHSPSKPPAGPQRTTKARRRRARPAHRAERPAG